jgi:hypothetical protein
VNLEQKIKPSWNLVKKISRLHIAIGQHLEEVVSIKIIPPVVAILQQSAFS